MGLLSKTNARYFLVGETSLAGESFSLQAGEVLRVDGPIPPAIAAFERQGLITALPDPGEVLAAWLPALVTIKPIGEATFRVRHEPAKPSYVDEGDVLRRFGWSPADLAQARARLSFPSPAQQRVKLIEGVGRRTIAVQWLTSDVDKWARESAALRELVPS